MSVYRKSLKDVKTHAGRVDRTFLSHKAYMRISCLEMEKAHRLREKESAAMRIESINKRIDEIEDEQMILLKGINAAKGKSLNSMKKSERQSDNGDKKSIGKYIKGFVHKY